MASRVYRSNHVESGSASLFIERRAPGLSAQLAMGVCIAGPWLNPFASGPSPSVVPLLVSLACAGSLLGLLLLRPLAVGTVALAWLIAALLSSLMGLLQYTGHNLLPTLINGTSVGEAFANLRQRNQFASLTNIGLAALLWWAASLPPDRLPRERLWLGGAALLLAAGNAVSSSRTGLVQLLLLLLFNGLWRWRCGAPGLWLVLLAIVGYGGALVALPLFAGLDPANHGLLLRLSAGDAVCSSRLTLWSNVVHLIAQRPWTGWGLGELDFAHYVTLFDGPRFCDILDNAHNLPLHLAVEFGLPLAVPLCVAGLWGCLAARPWREARPARQLAWSVLALILLHSMLEYPLWYGPFQMAALLCVWLLLRPGVSSTGAVTSISLRWRILIAPIAIASIAFTVYAGRDYQRISQIYIAVGDRLPAYRENTIERIRDSWLFHSQVTFAELTITALSRENAVHIHAMALELLHYSPESRVIEKLIESAVMLGLDDEARFHMLRYQAAFPSEYARWVKAR